MRFFSAAGGAVLSLFSLCCAFGEDATIAFVLAEREYDTLKTVPAFYESELRPLGFRATYIISPDDGDGRNDLKGTGAGFRCGRFAFCERS